MLLRIFALAVCVSLISHSLALTCYDCYSTGPDHKECTKERSCKGAACMIFDAGDNKTATAFCLLAMRGDENIDQKTGCWLEPDGRGKHCMCHTDYCNQLVDRRGAIEDPLASLLPDAQFLKQNPLVDYENPTLDEDSEEGAAPRPDNLLFPAAMKADPRTNGNDDEDDLVPVDFEEYDRDNKDKDVRTNHEMSSHPSPPSPSSPSSSDSVSSSGPPSSVLMWMTMAASWARVFVHFA